MLTSEQQRLVESAEHGARKAIQPHQKKYPYLRDEFESAAMLAITQAAASFDPARSSFATYATRRIDFAVKDVLRKSLPKGFRNPATAPQVLQLDGFTAESAGKVLLVREPESPDARLERADLVEHLLSLLSGEQLEPCINKYIHEKTHKQIAEELGISVQAVGRRLREALKVMREAAA